MDEKGSSGIMEGAYRFAERFGVPVVLLLALLWMIHNAAIALHGTVLVPVVQSHTEFLKQTSETLQEIGTTQVQQAKTLQELAAGQREIQQAVARPPRTGAAAN